MHNDYLCSQNIHDSAVYFNILYVFILYEVGNKKSKIVHQSIVAINTIFSKHKYRFIKIYSNIVIKMPNSFLLFHNITWNLNPTFILNFLLPFGITLPLLVKK